MEIVDHQGEVRIGDLYLWTDIVKMEEPLLFLVTRIKEHPSLWGGGRLCELSSVNSDRYVEWKEIDTELVLREWYRLVSRI